MHQKNLTHFLLKKHLQNGRRENISVICYAVGLLKATQLLTVTEQSEIDKERKPMSEHFFNCDCGEKQKYKKSTCTLFLYLLKRGPLWWGSVIGGALAVGWTMAARAGKVHLLLLESLPRTRSSLVCPSARAAAAAVVAAEWGTMTGETAMIIGKE